MNDFAVHTHIQSDVNSEQKKRDDRAVPGQPQSIDEQGSEHQDYRSCESHQILRQTAVVSHGTSWEEGGGESEGNGAYQ
jgi:hypothetical protein